MKNNKKAIQEDINAEIDKAIDAIENDGFAVPYARLRTCTAFVFETEHYYILRSYSTCVAAVNKSTGICYDFLRRVFGFTHTSAQHISKFWHDYGNGIVYTWRDIKE